MDKVQHFEIPADDIKRADKFYKNVFGWKIEDAGVKGMTYHMATNVETDKDRMPKEVGAINGALFERGDMNESPIIVMTVKDMKKSLKAVNHHGGSVVMDPMKVQDMGWYARIKDTEGNLMGLWQEIKKGG